MHIGLISAAFPPDLDGIGDYTWWMAKTLADLGHRVSVFTRKGPVTEVPSAVVVGFYDPERPESFADLLPVLERAVEAGDRPDWVVLQYNPFSWGRRGYCPAVPATLRAVRKLRIPTQVAVMFHETMVPLWPWRFTVMRTWQEHFFGEMCRAADRIFVSTERWLPQVASAHPRAKASLLPVGSNIPVSILSQRDAKLRFGYQPEDRIIGVFGGAHVSRRLDWIGSCVRELARRNIPFRLLHVGPDGDRVRLACEGVEVDVRGVLPNDEVADALRAMTVVVTPFLDGVSTRRGSVMAALASGVPVATTRTDHTDAVFDDAPRGSLLMSTAKTESKFVGEFADWIDSGLLAESEDIARFSCERFSWPVITNTLVLGL